MNTDLTVLGADLAVAVLRGSCLTHFRRDFARAARHGRYVRKQQYPCEPNIDQLLGWLVRNSGLNATLVSIVNGMQGHSWGTFALRPPASHSLYVHKILSDWGWTYYDASLSRRFAPLRRECLRCSEAGWFSAVSPSAAVYGPWTCCMSIEPPESFEPATFGELCERQRAVQLRRQKSVLALGSVPNGTILDGRCPDQGEHPSCNGHYLCAG